jgi:hypothetical protein
MWGEDWGTMIWGPASPVPTLGPMGLAFLAGLLLGTSKFLQGGPAGDAWPRLD